MSDGERGRALPAVLVGALRSRPRTSDAEIAATARRAGPHVGDAVAQTRVSPFTVIVDLRLYLVALEPTNHEAVGRAVDTAVGAVWRAIAGEVDKIAVRVTFAPRRPDDRAADPGTLPARPIAVALGLGVRGRLDTLVFPHSSLGRRFVGPAEANEH